MPKYLIITGSKNHPPIRKEFLPLSEAGIAYNNYWAPVQIGKDVLEDDGVTLREITQAERQEIANRADEYDSSK